MTKQLNTKILNISNSILTMKTFFSIVNLCIFILFLTIFNSCKSRADIAREQMIDTLVLNMKSSRKINTKTTSRIMQYDEQMNKLNGKIEELKHNNLMLIQKGQASRNKNILQLKIAQSEIKKEIEQLKQKNSETKKYLETVLLSIKDISHKLDKAERLSRTRKKHSKATLKDRQLKRAKQLYKHKNYSKALNLHLKLLKSKNYNHKEIAVLLHNIGMIYYNMKKYNKSIIYYSKLISDYSSSWYAINAYLFIARSFQRLNKIEEAKISYKALITKYPKSHQSQTAKKYLKELSAPKVKE